PARVIVESLDVERLPVLAELELPVERAIALDNRAGSGPALVRGQTELHRKFDSAHNDAPRIFVGDLLHRVRATVQKRKHLVRLETRDKGILDSQAKNVHEINAH